MTTDYGYRVPLKFDSVWYSHGLPDQHLACGKSDAPPEFGANPRYIRFIYDFRYPVRQIEMHRPWTTDSAVSQAIMAENRRLFDHLWKGNCAGFRP